MLWVWIHLCYKWIIKNESNLFVLKLNLIFEHYMFCVLLGKLFLGFGELCLDICSMLWVVSFCLYFVSLPRYLNPSGLGTYKWESYELEEVWKKITLWGGGAFSFATKVHLSSIFPIFIFIFFPFLPFFLSRYLASTRVC